MKSTLLKGFLFFIGIVILLSWVSPSQAGPEIESVYPTLGALNSPLDITIRGSGFDQYTRISMALDSGNRRSIIGWIDTSYAYDVVINENIAYVADGERGLRVIDINDPKNLQIIGEEDTPGMAYALALIGTNVIVADGEKGILVIDVSNPTNPNIVGSYIQTPNLAIDLAIVGNNAYVAYGFDKDRWRETKQAPPCGLMVVDISIPSNIQSIKECSLNVNAQGVAIKDNYAYLVGTPTGGTGDGSLVVVNISNPSSPTIATSIPMPSIRAHGITIKDDLAYIATYYSGIQVVDIGDPFNPEIIHSVDTEGRSRTITISGQTAYVADDIAGVAVLDITDPENIAITGTIDTQGQARAIVLNDTYAFVADGESGLQSIDISAPTIQQVINWVPTPGTSTYFEISDNYLYLSDSGGGLQVIDISDPVSAKIIGSVETNHIAFHVDVVGDTAFVADTRGGLQVVNISDPTNPYITGFYNPIIDPVQGDLWARYVTVSESDDIAFLTDQNELIMINVENPSNPLWMKTITGFTNLDGIIAVNGKYAYVPDKSANAVHVVDFSTPSSASIVKTVELPGLGGVLGEGKQGPRCVTIKGNRAFVANGDYGLCILDISNPANPVFYPSWSIDLFDRAFYVTVVGNVAYVADGDSGIQMVDISDPANMVVIGSLDTTGGAVCVSVIGNKALVSDFGNGLVVVPLPAECKPITVVNANIITCILASPQEPGHYNMYVFDRDGIDYNDEPLDGAVTFSDDVKNSKAIIVAGGNYCTNQESKLEEEFQQVANAAYRAFLYQGFRREDVQYLGPNLNVDADNNDLFDDVDGLNELANISSAFDTWAVSQSPHDIYVYLVGHGSVGYYKPNCERVLADEVKAWISGLKSIASGDVIFIYEACQSGAFLLNMDESAGSSPVLITSSKSNQESWFYDLGDGLISFSSGFWGSVRSRYGARLDTAFFSGKNNIKDLQTSWIDTNGDQRPNTYDDKTEILVVGRGYQPGKGIPTIGSISDSQSLDGSPIAFIWANGITTPDHNPAEVFALITPPCYNPVRSIPGTESDLVKVVLSDGNGDGVYEGSYNDFSLPGTYTITIYAKDSQGNLSDPRETYVYQSSGRDRYEFDNAFPQAREITLNDDMAQCRNFYDANDEDWIKFFGIAGNIYLVEASNLGPDNNVVIEIYDTDGTTLLTLKDDPTSGRADEALYWKCEKDGLYYARIRPAGPENTGKETDYRLEIYRPVAELFGSIAGTIKNSAGSNVEGVTVKTNVGASGVSKEGTYFMVHREGDDFVMTMKANGYQKKNIPNIDVEEAKTTFVNVSLEPMVVNTVPTIAIASPASNGTLFEGESVNFQATVTDGNAPFTYTWDFDNGAANANVKDPGDVTFATQGIYTVRVTVEDVDKDQASAEITVTVNKNTNPASVPDVSITSPTSNTTIVEGQSVNFQASLKGGNAPFNYTWNFNGGAAIASVEDPGNVIFSTPGTYTVRVTVEEGDNKDDHDSATVTVTVVADSKPVALIQSPATDVAVDAGGTVNFQGSVTGGNLPLTYTWHFDGAATPAAVEDPGNVIFAVPGTYTVTLTVKDANGDEHSDTVTITVNRSGGGGGGGCFLTDLLP